MRERQDKVNYYLNIAQTVAERGTCLRKNFGAIIVKDDVIISTGYSGAPRGRENCCDLRFCLRDKMNIPRGERYELCRSVHAEANAIIFAAHERMVGATLYLVCIDAKLKQTVPGTTSCQMCKRLIINAGIEQVIVRENSREYTVYKVKDWVRNDDSLGQMGY